MEQKLTEQGARSLPSSVGLEERACSMAAVNPCLQDCRLGLRPGDLDGLRAAWMRRWVTVPQRPFQRWVSRCERGGPGRQARFSPDPPLLLPPRVQSQKLRAGRPVSGPPAKRAVAQERGGFAPSQIPLSPSLPESRDSRFGQGGRFLGLPRSARRHMRWGEGGAEAISPWSIQE